VESRLVVTIDGRGAQTGARDVNTAVDSVRRNARDMTQQLESSFGRLKQSLFSVQGAIAGIGIGDFVRRSIQSFVEFERGLANVGKTTDIAGQQLQDLGKQIIDMSKRIPVARSELLNIAASAGQLGVEGSANILKFTETIARLGFASNLSGDEAATILARVINVAGESIDTVDKLASSIVYLGRTSAASESEIAKMVIELSKGTAQFKVTSANLVGLGTAMRELGQQPELARSSILRTFLELKSATDTGGESLKTLAMLTGMTGEQFKKTFQQDAFSAFMAFIGGLKSVIEQGGNAEQVLASLGLNGTEINAVLPLLAVNYDRVTERVQQANKAYQENADLNKVSQKAFDTTAGKIQLLKNAFDELLRKVGAEAPPAFNNLLDKLIAFSSSDAAVVFGKALGAVLQFIADNADLLAIALAGLAINRTIGLFVTLGKVGMDVVRVLRIGTIEAIANAAANTQAARAMVASQAAANLYVGTAGRAAAATGSLSLAARAGAIGTNLLNAALGLLGINGPAVASGFTRIATTIGGLLTRFASLQSVGMIAGVAMRGLSVAVGGLGVAFEILIGPVGWVILAVTALIATYQLLKDKIVDIGPLHASVANVIQATWNVVTQRVGDSVRALGEWISTGFSQATDIASQAFAALSERASAVWDSIRQAVSDTFASIKEAIGTALNDAAAYFGNLLEPVASVFSGIYDSVKSAMQSVGEYIDAAVQSITGIFQSMYDSVTGMFSGLKTYVADVFSGVIEYFGGLVDDIVGEANRLQKETDAAKSGSTSGKAADAAGKGVKVSDTAFGPQLPKSTGFKVDLPGLQTQTNKSGRGGSSTKSLSDELRSLSQNSAQNAQESGLDELGKRLADVDKAVKESVGSYDKLSAAQRKNVDDTKAQITHNFELEQSNKQRMDDQNKLAQLIEQTRTPQENYNLAIAELNRLQPTTAEGYEAIRRKAADLRAELEYQDPVLRENQRLIEQFNGNFESTFKGGLKSILTKGKDGWKDMLSGFKNLWLDTVTEIASRPIMDALLGQKSTIFGGRSGGLLGGIVGQLFGGGGGLLGDNQQQQQQSQLPWLNTPANDNFGQDQGGAFADAFGQQSSGSSGFLGMLGNLFSPSGTAGGGFMSRLGGLFSSLTSGLSGIFSNIGSIFSGILGGGSGGGFGGIINMVSGLFGGGQQKQQQALPWLDPDKSNFGQNQGAALADTFSEQSAGSSGFLGMLGNLFSASGAGGGFLSNLGGLFSSLTSGLSGAFSGIGGLVSGLFGGGGFGGGGGIMSLISTGLSLFGGFFADGGSVSAHTPIIVGERGPELFIPPVNGEIISNDVFSKASKAANDNLPRDMSKDIVTLMLAGRFGGFRADGGSVVAGMSYAGGERGRELFIPKNSGGSSSNDNNAQQGDNITVQMNITTQDAGSFRRSQGQIAADAARAINRAKRNL